MVAAGDASGRAFGGYSKQAAVGVRIGLASCMQWGSVKRRQTHTYTQSMYKCALGKSSVQAHSSVHSHARAKIQASAQTSMHSFPCAHALAQTCVSCWLPGFKYVCIFQTQCMQCTSARTHACIHTPAQTCASRRPPNLCAASAGTCALHAGAAAPPASPTQRCCMQGVSRLRICTDCTHCSSTYATEGMSA